MRELQGYGVAEEFARLCICRKGERGVALCGFGLRVESLGEMKNKYIYLLFSALSLWIYLDRKCALGESGRKRAVGGSVRASGGRACLSVRRRGERPLSIILSGAVLLFIKSF